MDCVHELISKKLSGVSVEQMMASVGIANRLREFHYSGIPFYIVDGRGFGDPLQLMKAVEIPYECITAEEVFESSDTNNVMFFCAKDLLMRINKVNPSVKQLLFFYSGFYVKSVDHNLITLGICNDDNDYCISKAELEKLRKIITFPIDYSYRFVRITEPDYLIDNDVQIKLLTKSIDAFLSNTPKNSGIVSGRGMYDALTNVINEFAEAGIKQNINLKAEMFKHKMLTSSINAGTVGLYRREFADAILSIYDHGNIGFIRDAFVRSAAIWRELGKRAMKQVNGNNAFLDREYAQFATPAIAEIKEIETVAMQKLQIQLSSY